MHKLSGFAISLAVVTCVTVQRPGSVFAADRTTCLVPLASDAGFGVPVAGQTPDQAFGVSPRDNPALAGWHAYMRLWKAHRSSPSEPLIRRFLGLPLTRAVDAVPRRGRSAPRWLSWRLGSYQQIDTPHFTIYSRADEDTSRAIAEDLERCYWVWTQMFFPLWEAGAQVSTLLAELTNDTDVAEYLTNRSARITVRRKLRVVLFRDAGEYRQSLGRTIPGIERSTGFYSDEKQTTFLYASRDDDAATRRHEMTHQLFREATRSSLGRRMPGEDSEFWLVEGIAGYFESLIIREDSATLGGWDASRLQYARYRMLVGGDSMPIRELIADGRLATQRRSDLARWYAHAIAQTHHLMDGGDQSARRWIYQKLAEIYAVKAEMPGDTVAKDVERKLNRFLEIDDQHLNENRISYPLSRLCLAGCKVTKSGLAAIPPSPGIRWLDLSRLPIGLDEPRRIASSPESLEQLSLEATRIDRDIANWLPQATNLQELDLSWTKVDDSVIESVANAKQLNTLWLTGTEVSDQSIEKIASMRQLTSIDLQRTAVTEAGIARLRKLRPQLTINPLELRDP